MGANITKEQEAELQQAFKRLDVDGSGAVDARKLQTEFGLEDIRDDVVDKIIKNADKNGDGKMDFEEWKKFVSTRFLRSFQQYDRDGDGIITIAELRETYRQNKKMITSQELDDVVKRLDVNADGKITLVEFVKGLFLTFGL